MTRAITKTWYRIALARGSAELTASERSSLGARENESPILVAAEGEHLGVAVAAAESFAKGSYAIAADRATEAVPLGESVGKQHVVALPDPVVATPFRWPRGVLPRLDSVLDVRSGFKVHTDPGLLVVEAQTTADKVVDTFLGLLEKLPSADNLEVRVLDHFEAATQTDVWLTSRVDGRRILSFLDDHDTDLIENGHIELSIYVRAHKATLRLTEHKTVVWLSDGDALRADVLRWMGELGLSPIDPLVTVSAGPHFHLRPAKSRDRTKLSEYLYRQRLRRVDKVATGVRETDG